MATYSQNVTQRISSVILGTATVTSSSALNSASLFTVPAGYYAKLIMMMACNNAANVWSGALSANNSTSYLLHWLTSDATNFYDSKGVSGPIASVNNLGSSGVGAGASSASGELILAPGTYYGRFRATSVTLHMIFSWSGVIIQNSP